MSQETADIVVTGAGLAAPLGLDKETIWAHVMQGHRGLGPLTALEVALPPGAEGGQAPDLPPDEAAALPREAAYLRHVIRAALAEAGAAEKPPYPAQHCGIVLGTTLHGMRQAGQYLRTGDAGFLRNFLATDTIRLATAGLRLEGWGGTICSACSSGLGSILLGATLLRAGELDLVVAGGYDPISEYTYAGFNSLRLIAPGHPRPFCRDRQGMKVSEGFGLVVLERAADAAARGAVPLARLAGWGETSDAFHLTKPHPEGRGAAGAMRQALGRAGITPEGVGLIAAHGTGTPDNDGAEAAALRQVFGPALGAVPVVAFKAALGHTLGGAGSVELILALMAMRSSCVPASPQVPGSQPEFPDLRLGGAHPRPATIASVMTNSLGFGGANTSVVLAPAPPANSASATSSATASATGTPVESAVSSPDLRANPPSATPSATASATGAPVESAVSSPDLEACITGIGVVLPGAVGNQRFIDRLDAAGTPALSGDTGEVSDDDLGPWLTARRVRRMSQYAKLTLAATGIACGEAGLGPAELRGRACGGLLGTTHGAASYCDTFYRQVVTEGLEAANPMLFAEGVCNAAAAHLSMMLEITGPCQAIIGGRTTGLDALRLAAMRIHSGEWDCAIVSAADEYYEAINRAYAHCGLYDPGALARSPGQGSGFATGAGAVTLVLESRAAARQRQARVLGVVTGSAAARSCRSAPLLHDAELVRGVIQAISTPPSGTALPGGGSSRPRGVIEGIGTPPAMILSVNGTRPPEVERVALARLARAGAPATVSALYGHVAECFSVMGLLGVAAVLLRGRLPALVGGLPVESGLQAATGQEPVHDWGVIASDYAGGVTAVRLRRGP